MKEKIQELGIYNIDKTTTMVGYATAVNKTMEQIAKKLKEQQSQSTPLIVLSTTT